MAVGVVDATTASHGSDGDGRAPARAGGAVRAAARNARPAADEAPLPPGEAGRLLLEAKCGKCHGLDRAAGSLLSDSGWNAHMKKMGRLPGAAITDEQASRIRAHLLQTAPNP